MSCSISDLSCLKVVALARILNSNCNIAADDPSLAFLHKQHQLTTMQFHPMSYSVRRVFTIINLFPYDCVGDWSSAFDAVDFLRTRLDATLVRGACWIRSIRSGRFDQSREKNLGKRRSVSGDLFREEAELYEA
ncbi:hypothetical protein H5410_031492 [Solanum commersonii]|uniref:Uncharacterized protein n=1 Tax=Solanum commersonii TaxID=4109 RepID=A0A9J5YIG3_SOLCO|nr:hypothetical protein H5410_031492 [Solanum commersonii]